MAFIDDLYGFFEAAIDPPKPLTVQDYRKFYEDEGYKYNEPETITDPRLKADVTAAKATSDANGNTKLSNTLDFILRYGDKALAILSRNGIIKNQNLIQAGYSNFSLDTGRYAADKDTSTNNAPAPAGRVFNIDFTDPKILIISFLIAMIIGYFILKPNAKNAKR